MTRSSVDLPQPDGPMSEMNSPRRISRSMPLSAVVTAVAAGEDLVDARDADDRGGRVGPGVGDCWSIPVILPPRRAGRAGRRARGARIITKNVTPSSDATRIAAHSFSGPVMYCWLKLMIARPRPFGIPPGPSPMIAPTIDAVAAILSAVNRYGIEAGRRTLR